MLLDEACNWLGWPAPALVLDPAGAGAAVYADRVKRKIGEPLKRMAPGLIVQTGTLAPDPLSDDSSAPLAIVCHFPSGAPSEVLSEAHRLAWNFSRTALLVTLEPHRLVAWSCLQDPTAADDRRRICTLTTTRNETTNGPSAEQRHARELLHWVSLITGNFFRLRPEYFPAEGRADALLLKNLRYIRRLLLDAELPPDICHDLLARIIFTQFLFHRTDSAGTPFFSRTLLAKRCEGALQRVHHDLASILQHKDETYALFRWLDVRFNGDLFPGQDSQSDEERTAAWHDEEQVVQSEHLRLLANLVSGTIDTTDRQLQLWPQYSFDTIPLEFISSVYEEFLNEDRDASKAYYTPSHLVDYVLDSVLPWGGDEWNLRILDPACGSGIFLVKAFQRLIHRWRRIHRREPRVRDLKPLLAKNLYGVDINPDAIRVACFSLYLAMADAIDPKHYVTRDKVFPRLRGTQLIAGDFFDETTKAFRTVEDAGTFDLVVGNAPWGENSIKGTSQAISDDQSESARGKKRSAPRTKAENWATLNAWPVVNYDVGPLFVAKGLALVNGAGRVAMIQPASRWLYDRAEPAKNLRRKLFSSFTVDEVTNLSAVRRELFAGVIGPSCVLVGGRGEPDPQRDILYLTPKPVRHSTSQRSRALRQYPDLRIEHHDVSRITHDEAATDPLVWSILALGGRRDLHLIRKLLIHTTLAKLKAERKVVTRLGVIPGDLRQKRLPEHCDKRFFDSPTFPDDVFLVLDADSVGYWTDPKVTERDSTDFEAFKNPQLLIKHSLSAETRRFRAALVRPRDPVWGVICKKTYLSVRDLSPDGRFIRAAALVYNSRLAAYYLALTSSRVGHYITETLSVELVTVPLPDCTPDLSALTSFDEIDMQTRHAFALTEAEWILIDDLLDISLPDALKKTPGTGRTSTQRRPAAGSSEPELVAYAETLTRVLKATFGHDKPIAVTVFQEVGAERLPVRMIMVHLKSFGRKPLAIEPLTADGLFDELAKFHRDVLSGGIRCSPSGGTGVRVAFLFQASPGNRGRAHDLTIIKPDEYRYWTRSQALRDADEIAAAILQAGGRKGVS